jgi:hypothetical protein
MTVRPDTQSSRAARQAVRVSGGFDPMAYESGYYASMRALARETDLRAHRASKSKYRAAP